MTKSEDKRFAAINTVSKSVLDSTPAGNLFLITDREEIARLILGLSSLGRTERWQLALAGWAQMVLTEENLEWAFLQGSVWASHAV